MARMDAKVALMEAKMEMVDTTGTKRKMLELEDEAEGDEGVEAVERTKRVRT